MRGGQIAPALTARRLRSGLDAAAVAAVAVSPCRTGAAQAAASTMTSVGTLAGAFDLRASVRPASPTIDVVSRPPWPEAAARRASGASTAVRASSEVRVERPRRLRDLRMASFPTAPARRRTRADRRVLALLRLQRTSPIGPRSRRSRSRRARRTRAVAIVLRRKVPPDPDCFDSDHLLRVERADRLLGRLHGRRLHRSASLT
jgi:hypothetical protein